MKINNARIFINGNVKKTMKKAFLFIILLTLLNSVYAFGATTFYGDVGNRDPLDPLKAFPGDSKEIYLELQNMVGDNNITLKAVLVNGSGIASLTDESELYEVPLGRKDIKVNIKVKIPENAKPGDIYDIGIAFTTVKTEGPGQLRFGQSVERHFNVLVIEKTPAKKEEGKINNWIAYLIIGIIAIAIIIFFARKKNMQ